MGQYYIPTLISQNGAIHSLYSHSYNNGLKLMEHSYIGNDFVNAVCTQIWHNPTVIAWIGDYSDEPYEGEYCKDIPKDRFMEIYRVVWGENNESTRIHPKPYGHLTMKNCRRYLVNHTKQIYIDMQEYIQRNQWHESGTWTKIYKNGRVDQKHYDYNSCIHPLPLLTACGNGRGGGDYHDCFPDYDKVGTWAFCEIELTGKRPKDYEQVMYHFTEQKRGE